MAMTIEQFKEKLRPLRESKYKLEDRYFWFNWRGYTLLVGPAHKTPEPENNTTERIRQELKAGDPRVLEFHSVITRARLNGIEVRGWP